MQIKYILVVATFLLQLHCNKKSKASNSNASSFSKTNISVNKVNQIALPSGYNRIVYNNTSFENYLQNINLLQSDTVFLYNGIPKTNQNAHFSILDISVGNKDLQQCADAVMRLRAEYLFAQKKYDEITFIDNDRKVYAFAQPYTKDNLLKYLDKVFGMCGSASLAIQLHSKPNLQNIQPGDVFIKGGFPGHACIVMDVAENKHNEKIFMLAQSYMPAQQIHILKNYANVNENPWYIVNEIDKYLQTPEYTFTNNQLKSW